MKTEYTPVNYKPEKVGKKYRIELMVYSGSFEMESTIWGDTPEQAMQKAGAFLKGSTPKAETNDQH